MISNAQIDPRTLGGIATLLVAALLCLLYVYRRRTYIVCWVSGWIVIAFSLLLAAHGFQAEKAGYAAYGISQFLAIVGALGFVLAADAYRARPRVVGSYALVLLPVFLWFSLAPLALRRAAAFVPGHLLIAGALTTAGLGHLRVLRQTRLLGALVVGVEIPDGRHVPNGKIVRSGPTRSSATLRANSVSAGLLTSTG